MTYYFDKEYNGEVIAESKREDLESFLGLHYPHTDIPVQARELYIKNLLRVIVDVDYQPVPIYTVDDGSSNTLDLSHSVLRSVSPIHVQYLHNMGVGATLTISLIYKKKLWGLIACHHYSPKYLSHETRMAARLQGHFITSQIDVRQLNEEYDISKTTNHAAEALISRKYELNRDSLRLMTEDPDILKLCNASGVSVLLDDKVYKNGLCPGDMEVKKLASDLAAFSKRTQFNTDSLARDVNGFESLADKIAGVAYFSLDQNSDNCIMWYRPETISEVNWAGDPGKAIEKDKGGLSPRKSFELWKEIVKHRSKPWLQPELDTASHFTNVLQKHLGALFLAEEEEKLRALASTLTEMNAELENINWISTHDLQEPLRKIQVMSSYMLEGRETPLSSGIHDKVSRMNKSAGQMQNLIKDILKYTQLKYSRDAFESVDLNLLIADVGETMQEPLQSAQAVLEAVKLPVIKGVSFLLKQLFSNLIYNSLKFADAGRSPVIRIDVAGDDDKNAKKGFYLVRYTDNGIGFDEKHNESIFNIFTRLHGLSEYAGSGIGLALCKKIMATHRGLIRAQGHPGKGAEFFVYFPIDA